MVNTAVARIDLSALQANLRIVRNMCPRSRVMAMVKADAYGHGLCRVAGTLSMADGFAVARLQEALELRSCSCNSRILLLATLLEPMELAMCSDQRIDVTAHDEVSVSRIAAQARRTPLRVWLKHDSGMHRLGLDDNAFIAADKLLARHPGVIGLTHMTHFSAASNMQSDVTEQQMLHFERCREECSKVEASLANSAALISRAETHGDWVRPGLMLYGDNPFGPEHPVRLRPAMTLKARVIAIRRIGTGQYVGYDGCWTSNRPSLIATVGIGYGDGYPRHAGNGTPVCINGQPAPVVGRISMDSLTVDVTECARVTVGDEVVLWGEDVPVSTVAKWAGTVSYELLTSVRPRVTREYVES